jgi:hypothetical protein
MTLEIAAQGSVPAHQPLDRLGALASAACTVHCVAGALLPEALGAAGVGAALLGHETEWGFTCAAVAFASVALYLGWRRHRSRRVVSMLSAGIAVLLLARLSEGALSESLGLTLSVLAGVTLVVGHFSNIRASRRVRLQSS